MNTNKYYSEEQNQLTIQLDLQALPFPEALRAAVYDFDLTVTFTMVFSGKTAVGYASWGLFMEWQGQNYYWSGEAWELC